MAAQVVGDVTAPWSCLEGCSACCRDIVFTDQEFVALVEAVGDPALRFEFIKRAVRIKEKTGGNPNLMAVRGRCPLNVDGRCTVYDQRPLNCRNFFCNPFYAELHPEALEANRPWAERMGWL